MRHKESKSRNDVKTVMGRQYNKVEKRSRRQRYLKRKRTAIKAKLKAKAPAKAPAEAAST